MRILCIPTLFLVTAAFSASAIAQNIVYPETHKDPATDEYHGVKIRDDYRWLEDDNADVTKDWVKRQNAVTFSYLEKIPQRAEIFDRLKKLWNFERYGMPYQRSGRYFYTRNSGLQNQSVLYSADSLTAEPRVLIDPNLLSADGTVSLTESNPSEDGKWLVYGVSRAGSDWQEFRVKNIDTGEDLPEILEWIKFGGASWAKDGSGFYYGRYPKPSAEAKLTEKNLFYEIYFHRLNTAQSEDKLIHARPDKPTLSFDVGVSDDGRYLIINTHEGTEPKNDVSYQDLQAEKPVTVELLTKFDAAYRFVGNVGTLFYFHTDLDAPRYRLIAIDVADPASDKWREIIPQTEDKLDSVSFTGGQLICEYLHDAHSQVTCFTPEGKRVQELTLPGLGSVVGFRGRQNQDETFYAYTSFTTPSSIYRYEVSTGKSSLYRQPKIDFDGERYQTQQVFVTSKDGTRVPMFLVHKRGIKLDGTNPTLLYGYGGFDISLTPGFSVSRAVWLERGGVFALANLRGGGEYGSEWHQAGTKLRKQNVFDDFIASAEWLISNNYTRPAKLAIQGGSNGGLLVGACLTQRPELFGAAIPSVGVLDMLRYQNFTIGWAWASDYGTSADAAEFKALLAYSPLHNLKPGVRYPATLVTTADHDDRVVPAHSFKFAARLQECQAADGPPVLIRIETSAGHGAGTALTKVIAETADEWAFLEKVLGME